LPGGRLASGLPLVALAVLALAGCGASEGPGSQAATAATHRAAPAAIDWPIFGRVVERTHFFPRGAAPPFHALWQFWAHQLIEFPPALADGRLYVVNKVGEVYAVRTGDGKVVWKRNLDNDVTGPAYADGLVYVGQYDGDFAALDARTGKERWSFDPHSHIESSPLVVGGDVYFGDDDGYLWAVNGGTGKVAWKVDLGAPVKASPSFHDGIVYVGDYAGRIHAVGADSGRQRWTLDTTELPPGGDGGFYSSPAIALGHLYEARDDGPIFATTLDGRAAWHFETGGHVYGSPAVAYVRGLGPTVFIGSYDDKLYALDALSGRRRWSYDVGGTIPGSPTVIGATVYTSSFETEKTVALEARTGRRLDDWGDPGYEPMISDGRRLFRVGYQTIFALGTKPG
jgi:outer membrane protein assembly factor BamB